ncbi:hypothetical protein EYY60_10110 [Flavobacterium zhairuonense]|uniref:hypothetical protein n=1 Tax=Flavobacterium zhairuonense TaxID=2493631 RepID=UPI001044C5A6|nr:hypothetical protein [Flavobacterium zhairuonense]KAF2510848.1 hypothetical protein EYY60_10110 [Flavobacterium zhairuonense]
MKKIALLITTVCVTALTYISCSGGDDIANQTDTTAVGASISIDAANEMDVNTGLSVTNSSGTSKPAGAVCATITVSGTSYPKVYTVDYGTTGCIDNQLTRKGKLKLTLTGPVTTTGSKLTIERIDYSINGIKLEGTIEYTNTTTVATVPQFTRKVTNGKFTDLLGRVYTNSGTYTVKQTAGVDTPFVLEDNVYEMTEGTHTVTTDKGATLTLTVQESLIKKYSCQYISKGKLKIEGGFLKGVIDYGNNDCDSKFTYTHESGVSYNLQM